MAKLFISYRSLDSKKVDRIISRLRTLQNDDGSSRFEKIWQDKSDINPGEDWWEAIVDGILECEVFVLMVSKESVQNVNCRAELSYAVNLNRPIVPIVLEDEYYYNEITGKNDIRYWEHVPEEIKEGRYQFLFYEGTVFVSDLNDALREIADRTWQALSASRPPDPRHANDERNSNTVIYNDGCDYAFRGDFDAAQKKFRRLMNRNDDMYGEVSFEWIELIREYKKILELHQQKYTHFQIPELWKIYIEKFPKEFLEDIFDPQNLNHLYTEKKTTGDEGSATEILISPEPQKRKTGIKNKAGFYLGGAVLLIAIFGIFALGQGVFANNSSPTPEETNITGDVAEHTKTIVPNVEPTVTETSALTSTYTAIPTHTLTLTITPTADIRAAAQALLIQQSVQKTADAATAMAEEQTLEAQHNLTQEAIATETATVWTKTPTPDFTASVAALLTQWVEETMTQESLAVTGTAVVWTETPTPTIDINQIPEWLTQTAQASLPTIPTHAFDAETCIAMSLSQGGVNARPGAGTTTGAPLYRFPYLAEATVIAVEESKDPNDPYNWVQLDFQGEKGWIREDFLALTRGCESFGLIFSDSYSAPLANYWWTRGFNLDPNFNPVLHHGWDLSGNVGEPVYAGPNGGLVVDASFCVECGENGASSVDKGYSVSDSRVLSNAGWNFGYGHFINILYRNDQLPESTRQLLSEQNKEGWDIVCNYSRLHSILIVEGQVLTSSTQIGTLGNSGNSTGPHLSLDCRSKSPDEESTDWAQLKSGLISPAILFIRLPFDSSGISPTIDCDVPNFLTTSFEISATLVRIRSEPSVLGTDLGSLAASTIIDVDPMSRTEADGYIWWKHDLGWSVEKSTDGAQIFLQTLLVVDGSVIPITSREGFDDLDRIKLATYAITGAFEGSGYAAYNNYDAGIISYGFLQSTLATGSLTTIIQRYLSNSQTDVANQLRDYLPRIEARDGGLRNDETLKNLLIAAADEQAMIDAQHSVADETYWSKIWSGYIEPRGLTAPLSIAFLFDMGVNFGTAHGFVRFAEQELGIPSPSIVGQNGVSEEELIAKVAELRKASHDKQAEQDNLPSLSERGNFWVRLINQGDWGLLGDENGDVSVRGNLIQVCNP